MMNKVYLVFTMGEEDPLAVCSTLELAEKCVAVEDEENPGGKAWFEIYNLVEDASQIAYVLGYT